MPTSRPGGLDSLEPDEWQSMNALLLLNRKMLTERDKLGASRRRELPLVVTTLSVDRPR